MPETFGETVEFMLIDSHAHLDTPAFDTDRAEVITRARSQGIGIFLEIAGSDVGKGSLDTGIALADQYDFIYAAVGLHPHEASLYDEALEQKLLQLAAHKKVLGWGEIGLDYYYDHSPREIQQRVFRRQLELAIEVDLPVIIHTRDAEEDTIEILNETYFTKGGATRSGVIHCFTGTQKLADAALEMGFLISFSGVVTFKKSDELRAVAQSVPLDRLLVETDCPYLAPVPYRGKRNEPAFVRETAYQLAQLHDISFEEMAQRTSNNFKRLFCLN